MILRSLVILLLPLMVTHVQGQTLDLEDQWVDSVLHTLTLDQCIGQLFMIRAHSNLTDAHVKEVERQIKTYGIGGICFFQGTPGAHARLINQYQKLSPTLPIMVGIDAEWGPSMRFKEASIDFPRALMLGAIQDNSLIYDFGAEVARQLKRVGIHINFAPVVDINNNANNPVINHRSFGEDKYNVTTKGYMYMRGMQDHQVAACAKHFPGHGDTNVDSHEDLPVIKHSKRRLEEVELFPFETLINHDVASVMIAHLYMPALGTEDNLPTSLSPNVVGQLLRKNMGYDGLVFTDALEMKAVSDRFVDGELEIKALEAGNDILLLPNDIDQAFKAIKSYVAEGKMDSARIRQSTQRILRAKYRMDLHNYRPVSEYGVKLDLNNAHALSLKHTLIENALTLARDKHDLVPMLDHAQKVASLSIGSQGLSHFQVMINEYEEIPRHLAPHDIDPVMKTELLHRLSSYDQVIVSLHNMSQYAKNDFGLKQSAIDCINALNKQTKVILVVFGNPYSLKYFDAVGTIAVCYDNDRLTQNLAAQALFGATGFKGRLPVTATEKSAFGMGIDTKSNQRIGYSVPARVGMQMDSIKQIDRIIHELINRKAAPGAQLLIAKSGKVVYQKEYGYHTYLKDRPVQRHHVYDLASVTKVTAATMAIMKLYEEGKVQLDQPIARYIPELEGTNKAKMTLEQIMSHQAGLKPWIPFYRNTLSASTGKPAGPYYDSSPSDGYAVKVTNDLYLRSDYPDSIWHYIIESDVNPPGRYRYSDLGFYMIAKIIENVSGMPIDQYVRKYFYDPLHMSNTTYRPLERIKRQDIVPSEKDSYFRHADVRGFVHDMGAAMLSGVSGHAGLFSNSQDLVKLHQMLLNDGFYGGRRYLKAETIRRFAQRPKHVTRRGIGFDMKELSEHRKCNVSKYASDATFGHYGFTGTCIWVDPTYDLIYIFLSNRTYPSMQNNLLNKDNYRSRIQEAVYKSFLPDFVQD
ncbi:MAG: serine hydrolase [Saprospiraceae bacterium]|nr:serine hydrolase [Saprospiraceae bacterium]